MSTKKYRPKITCNPQNLAIKNHDYSDKITKVAAAGNLISNLAEYIHKQTNQDITQPVLPKFLKIVPTIKIDGCNVTCDEKTVQLSRKPLKLFKAFYNAPHHRFSKSELIDILYSDDYSKNRSTRLNLSLNSRFQKLMSRTRKYLNKHLNGNDYQSIEWLTYHSDLKKWSFFYMTSRCLAEKQQEINTYIKAFSTPSETND